MAAQQVDPLEQSGTQCLVVLQLLRSDHEPRWSRWELERELYDVDPDAIGVALERLREREVVHGDDRGDAYREDNQGVVHEQGERVWASACARHLDALGFICI